MTLTITPDQQAEFTDRARAFLAAAAAEDRGVLAAHLNEYGGDVPADDRAIAAALGMARLHLVHLLAVIDSLTGLTAACARCGQPKPDDGNDWCKPCEEENAAEVLAALRESGKG